MVEKMDNIFPLHPPITAAKPVKGAQTLDVSPIEQGGASFGDYLATALRHPSEVSFSTHAQRRLTSRGIEMSSTQMDRLGRAVDLAGEKGGRDSLVMLDGLALIVNVPSRTVVTAMDVDGMAERVVTNIDSAVVG
jgi:flagellar operon protein